MIPQLKGGTERLKQIQLDSANSHLKERISSIDSWASKAELLFPTVCKFLAATGKSRVI